MKDFFLNFFIKLSCPHDWKSYYRSSFYEEEETSYADLPFKITDTLIYQKCGKIKKITL